MGNNLGADERKEHHRSIREGLEEVIKDQDEVIARQEEMISSLEGRIEKIREEEDESFRKLGHHVVWCLAFLFGFSGGGMVLVTVHGWFKKPLRELD